MKKMKDELFLLLKNRQMKRALMLVCFIALVIGGIFVGLRTAQEKERVSAHPTNIVTLDQGGTNQFEVPVDALTLREPALSSQAPTYDNHVQGLDDLPILVKDEVRTFWSKPLIPLSAPGDPPRQADWIVRDVQPTANGNYFVLFGPYGVLCGGVTGTAVINGDGDYLYLKIEGELSGTDDRLNTRLFSSSNGSDFLVGTNGNKFYRYSLSNETDNSVTVNRTRVSANLNNSPNIVLGVAYYQITDSIANSNDRTDVIGQIYFDRRPHVNASPRGLFKVPVANISISGWQSATNPSFSINATYQYTLDTFVPPGAENISGRYYGNVVSHNSVITNDHIYGGFDYLRGADGGVNMKTVQVFDKNDNFYENGATVKRRKVLYENRATNAQIYMLNELCTDDEIYFVSTEQTESKLIKIDLTGSNAYNTQVLKTYPVDTNLSFVVNPDDPSQLFFFGSTSSLTGEFYHPVLSSELSGTNFYIQGITDRSFDGQSIYATPIATPINPAFMKQGNGRALIFGSTSSRNTLFIDKQTLVGETGELTDEDAREQNSQAFIGSINAQTDYPPAIKAEKNIELDITNPALNGTSTNTMGWTFLDNWLITGAENGTLNSDTAIKVYDFMDSNDSIFGQTWVEKRINRNPKNVSAGIDWAKLGFDRTRTGPQIVTYFATDSQWQPSVTTRWINKKTPETVKEGDYYLDAQNFHIKLDGISTAIPDEAKFKELAKTMAWNGTNGQIDEDGSDPTKLSGKVTVDATQLQALRDATEARPYPVDVAYTPESGVEITNRVWVFTTVKNTLPNTETNPAVGPTDTNGVVYYADDYSMPFRLRGSHTDEDVRTRGNIRVYDYYDNSHETDAVLPTLVDMSNATERAKLEIRTINQVRNAPSPGILNPPISVVYKWDRGTDNRHTNGVETIGSLDITLFSDALLHVRQVIRDPSNEIVVPDEGYVTFKKTLDNSGNPAVDPNYHSQAAVLSGKEERTLDFTTFAVNTDDLTNGADQLNLEGIIPEFYQYEGYHLTDQTSDAGGASHKAATAPAPTTGGIALNRTTIDNLGEFWLTIYVKPIKESDGSTNKTPQPYSWNYQHNDLGKIEPK